MMKFLGGAAAIALIASAAHADPGGNGKGGGNNGGGGGGKNQAAQVDRGGGKPDRGGGGGGERMRGPKNEARVVERGGGGGNDRGQGRAKKEDRGPARTAKEDRGGGKPERMVERGESGARGGKPERADKPGRSGGGGGEFARGGTVVDADGAVVRVRDRNERHDVRFGSWSDDDALVRGCPPGLAKKNNGCMPPGLAMQQSTAAFAQPSWWGYDQLNDDRFGYWDGYLVRYDGDSIGSYLPLLGGALAPGNAWPSFYDPVPVPNYYNDFYGLGAPDSYRYADDVIYRVDPQTSAITAIAALLTGDDISVGEPLPMGYSVYNVPYAYRDRYVDGPDALYRYSDGYVYQVDPETRLVAAVIELLT